MAALLLRQLRIQLGRLWLRRRYWKRCIGAIGMGAVSCAILGPAAAPLGVFALLLALWGGSLVSVALAVCVSIGCVWVLPHLPFFHAREYVNGGNPLRLEDLWRFFMAPMDAVIVGLFVLNVFFETAFRSALFEQTVLPWFRSKVTTVKSRLSVGFLAAVLNFSDDLASGGILNRLYGSDIRSPGVKERVKTEFLAFILLLANSVPALILCSSWGAFYSKTGYTGGWQGLPFFQYPLMVVLFCLVYAMFRRSSRTHTGEGHGVVMPVDFLRTDPPKGRGVGIAASLFCVTLCSVSVFLGLFALLTKDNPGALLQAFLAGFVLLVGVLTALAAWPGFGIPAIMRVGGFLDGVAASIAKLGAMVHERRQKLAEHPYGHDTHPGSPEGPGTDEEWSRLAALNDRLRSLEREHEDLTDLADTDVMASDGKTEETAAARKASGLRDLAWPSLRPVDAAFHRVGAFWRGVLESHLRKGLEQMVTGLASVYLVLVLSEVLKVGVGASLNASPGSGSAIDPARVRRMLEADSLMGMLQIIGPSSGPSSLAPCDTALANGIFGVLLVLLLWVLRELRFSSAWGILALVYPIAQTCLVAIHGQPHPLLEQAAFGLILSFGVWANQTLPTGDNVAIAAEMHGRDAEALAGLAHQLTGAFVWTSGVFLLCVLMLEPCVGSNGLRWSGVIWALMVAVYAYLRPPSPLRSSNSP